MRDHRSDGKMAFKYKIFVAVIYHFMGIKVKVVHLYSTFQWAMPYQRHFTCNL